jgi:3-hydroxyisobutyrate dehydrogenase
MVDAPVSGGVGGATNGTLTFMVGGAPADFERAKPTLSKMGQNIVHCGDVGTGEVAKICNNLVLGVSMAAVSEAINLGVKLGIDPKVLSGVMNTSSGRCWSSDTYNPCPGVMPNVPASRGYSGGFATPLMLKDLTLATAAGAASHSPLPMAAAAQQLYETLCAHGHTGLDFSSVYKFLAASQGAK